MNQKKKEFAKLNIIKFKIFSFKIDDVKIKFKSWILREYLQVIILRKTFYPENRTLQLIKKTTHEK